MKKDVETSFLEKFYSLNALLSGAKLLAKIARNEASQLFSLRLSNFLGIYLHYNSARISFICIAFYFINVTGVRISPFISISVNRNKTSIHAFIKKA